MAKVSVLIEIEVTNNEAFGMFQEAVRSERESVRQSETLLERLTGLGVELDRDPIPVPMFVATTPDAPVPPEFEAFPSPETNPDLPSSTVVVPARVEVSDLEVVSAPAGVHVWPNSELTMFGHWDPALREIREVVNERTALADAPGAPAGLDCRPFRPGVEIDVIRQLLGVSVLWDHGIRGEGVIVGIIDEGIDGTVYSVVGGFSRPGAQAPGTAPVTSHGSMCAADVLVAAPDARLYDYPFLGIPSSGGALAMFQAVLDQRRMDGTPHLTSNSYGFVGVPPRDQLPTHEIWDLGHPLHRKVREVIASGAPAFFAAGNCGKDCPSGACQPSGIGPGTSIHASNSLEEVITIAAVNSRHERIGYSSQGPGMFATDKPDLSAYSHLFANFGPGRPGGETEAPFDNGTSAATPVAAGVAALLVCGWPQVTPAQLRDALVEGATGDGSGWSADFGRGVVNAAAAFAALSGVLGPPRTVGPR
jgi:subtilisin family serine protease